MECCAAPAGIVVAADTPEGSQALAANQRYTECLAEAASSDKCSTSYSQTPMVLLKHKEVQSGSSSNQTVACQATGYDIHDSYALLNKDQGDEADDQLGSVLPSGAVVSAGEHCIDSITLSSGDLSWSCWVSCSCCLLPTA
jgi:hypothetical protein